MLLESTEVNVELVQRLKQLAERSALGHHSEGVDILREALASIAKLAIRTRDIGVGVIDVTREEHAGVYCTPICTHLLAIFTTSIEIGYLVCTKHIMHILSEFGLQRSHYSKLLAHKYFGQ